MTAEIENNLLPNNLLSICQIENKKSICTSNHFSDLNNYIELFNAGTAACC